MPIVAGDKQRPAVPLASWLAVGNHRRLVSGGSHVAEPFAETAATKSIGAAEKLDGIIYAERGNGGLHDPQMFVA